MGHQKGFAHAVLIIGVVVLILGILGFVFWQNFMRQNQDSEMQNNTTPEVQVETPPAVELIDGKTDNDFKQSLSFKYPSNWTLKNTKETTQDGTSGERMLSKNISTVTSPDGKYVVKYVIAKSGGMGGICAPIDRGTYTSVETTKLPALKPASDSTVPTLIEGESVYQGKYSRKTSIVQGSNPKVGGSTCEGYMTAIRLGTFENYPILLVEARVIVEGYLDENGYEISTSDRAALTAAYETDYYKAARDILLSTKN